MEKREVGWGIFLAGLPFAHFFWHGLPIAEAQALWAMLGLLSVVAWTFLAPARLVHINRPLACWLLWIVGDVR